MDRIQSDSSLIESWKFGGVKRGWWFIWEYRSKMEFKKKVEQVFYNTSREIKEAPSGSLYTIY